MKTVVIFACVIATTAAATLNHLDYEWKEWKSEHGKMYYDAKEETVRRDIWEKNLQFVDLHNHEARQGKHSFTVRMNKFADLTDEEFKKMFLSEARSLTAASCSNTSIYVTRFNYEIPDSIDWRAKGYVTNVKNQGTCKSCWAFSTIASIEGAHFKATGKLVSLSEQNLMDCSKPEGDFSCEGGLMEYAFEYVMKNDGVDTEASYPYKGMDESVCKYTTKNRGATIRGCVDVTPREDENALKKAVGSVGPVSIAMDASQLSFRLYHEGIYSDPNCSPTLLDHGVVTVGYGTDTGSDYWIVKNSWGADWGDAGYVKMSRNNGNNCGVATEASYPVV